MLNRIIAHELRGTDNDETTIVQIRVLSHLIEAPITMSELAKRRRVSLQAASEHVQGLVEREWVRRVADENDRRRYLLHITDAGRTQFEQVRQQLIDSLIPTLDKLSAEDANHTRHILEVLRPILLEHPID